MKDCLLLKIRYSSEPILKFRLFEDDIYISLENPLIFFEDLAYQRLISVHIQRKHWGELLSYETKLQCAEQTSKWGKSLARLMQQSSVLYFTKLCYRSFAV
jgi:hypothetical protein